MEIFIYNLRCSLQYSRDNLRRSRTMPGPTTDEVDYAFENIEFGDRFFKQKIDLNTDHDIVHCLVNYGTNSKAARWDAPYLVLGSGDAELNNMAFAIDIVVHELTHALLERRNFLQIGIQSQAINEHICDVIGLACRYDRYQTSPEQYQWLLGDLVVSKEYKDLELRKAVRDWANPGSAHEKDDQTHSFADLASGSNWINTVSAHDLMAPLNYLVVKFIQSSGLDFNFIAKTWWRAAAQMKQNPTIAGFLSIVKSKLPSQTHAAFDHCLSQIDASKLPEAAL